MKVQLAKHTELLFGVLPALIAIIISLSSFGVIQAELMTPLLVTVLYLWLAGFFAYESMAGGFKTILDILGAVFAVVFAISGIGILYAGFTVPILSGLIAQYTAVIFLIGSGVAWMQAFTKN